MKQLKNTGFIILFLSLMYCDDIIEVEDISKKEVLVLAPTNNAILNTNDITFTWETLEDAETYHVQVATPSFANATQIVKDSVMSGTSFSTTLNYNNYEWRIRAENSGYTTSYSIQSFTIEE